MGMLVNTRAQQQSKIREHRGILPKNLALLVLRCNCYSADSACSSFPAGVLSTEGRVFGSSERELIRFVKMA